MWYAPNSFIVKLSLQLIQNYQVKRLAIPKTRKRKYFAYITDTDLKGTWIHTFYGIEGELGTIVKVTTFLFYNFYFEVNGMIF
jgi:hypothetical protein